MPRQNRITPNGALVAVPDRGLFLAFRGALLDRGGNLARYSAGRAWAICALEFKGRRRQQWQPGKLTELYVLDEATGLAAGHRPCGECRYRDYQAFKRAWSKASLSKGAVTAPVIDERLHADRLAAAGLRRTYTAALGDLPAGVMVDIEGEPWLVQGDRLLRWTPSGYDQAISRTIRDVTVITPRATVAVLAAGYSPVLHASASPS